MKKLIFVFGLMLAMVSCGGNATGNAEANDSTAVDTVEVVDSIEAVDSVAADSVAIG